jgi:hypothetical protein
MSGSFVRRRRRIVDNYTQVSNVLIRDVRISPKAKGLAVWLLSHSAEYRFSIASIADKLGVGQDQIKSGLKELEKFGYLERIELREAGRMVGMEYVLDDDPAVQLREGETHRRETTEGLATDGKPGGQEEDHSEEDQGEDQGDLFSSGSPAVEKAQGRQPEAPQASTEPLGGDTDGLDDIWEWFEKAWEVYGRKGSKKTSKSRWMAAIDRVLAGRREVNDKRKAAGEPERYGYGQLFGEAAAEWLVERAKQYALNRPDRTYRKDFERWLGHEIFATPECEPNVMATTYTSEFETGAEPGQLPWDGPWDDEKR